MARALAAGAAAAGARHAEQMSGSVLERTRRGAEPALAGPASREMPPQAGSAASWQAMPLDMNTLQPGARIQFRYSRGTRPGEIRTVEFLKVLT